MSDEPRVKIFYNKNLGMSPGKLAAQSVHAALELFGVHPGYPVVVLSGSLSTVNKQEAVIVDEGRTEIRPGSTTAGASLEFPVGEDSMFERVLIAHKTMERAEQAYHAAWTEWQKGPVDND